MNGIKKEGKRVSDVPLRGPKQPLKFGATYFAAERHKLEMKARAKSVVH